jgi:TusA-related sulfurtransferase
MTTPTRIQLDIFGQVCPSCLLLALKTMNQNSNALRAGETEIIIMTDDRQATSTIPAAANTMGYKGEVIKMNNGYQIRIYGA